MSKDKPEKQKKRKTIKTKKRQKDNHFFLVLKKIDFINGP
jgi:hypothetical protein